MKSLTCSAWLMTLLSLTAVESLEAQRRGIGGILDWINKLSGPSFVGAGATISSRFGTLESRRNDGVQLAVIYRHSVSETGEVTPASADIIMWTARGTLELTVFKLPYGTVDFGFGPSIHRFAGADFDDFTHFSLPLQLTVRPWSLSGRDYLWNGFGVGLGLNIFPKFDATDFAPLVVGVSRDKTEAVFGITLSFGILRF